MRSAALATRCDNACCEVYAAGDRTTKPEDAVLMEIVPAKGHVVGDQGDHGNKCPSGIACCRKLDARNTLR